MKTRFDVVRCIPPRIGYTHHHPALSGYLAAGDTGETRPRPPHKDPPRMFAALLLLLPPAFDNPPADRFRDAPAIAARVDALLAEHWQRRGLTPATPADDATFLRRLTLDLAGRVPTFAEARAFTADRAADKRLRATRRLLDGPEYPLHTGRWLDAILQDRFAGDAEFVEFLRAAAAARTPWDRLFRQILLGPWDTKESKRANRFLVKRQGNLDDLTNDTARAFFGVNVSCAKCHDHPLVPDWKQDHYFGMASFFARTYEAGKGKNNGDVAEKATAEPVAFVTTKGERRTAKTMFLSGRATDDKAAGRREELVRVALEDRTFFRRAIVNRLWGRFFGQALVQPLDQMHSANPPSVPGLLEWLADDFASHDYDLDRLVAGLVTSRAYALDSRPPRNDASKDNDFARALLKPLTPHQMALSAVVVLGEEGVDVAKRYRDLEGAAGPLLKPNLLDGGGDKYHASAGEALFLSNHADVQKMLAPTGRNLAARLAALTDVGATVDTAVWTLLGRGPEADERAYLMRWLTGHGDRRKAASALVWAILTSAEFRFNH